MDAAWVGRRLERKLIAREDGHPMARDGPEAKAVRVGQPVLRASDNGSGSPEGSSEPWLPQGWTDVQSIVGRFASASS